MKKILTIIAAIMFLPIAAGAQMPSSSDTLRIAHLCDPQIGFYKDSLFVDIAAFEREIENVNALRPDLVVIAGDMVNIPDSTYFGLFTKSVSKLEVPVVYTPGNHDIYAPATQKGIDNYTKVFGPDLTVTPVKGRTLISFNTQLFGNADPKLIADHRQRLEQAVENAGKQGGGVIMLSHIPPFVVDIDEKEEYFNLPKSDRRALLDLFGKNGVFIWLCGHTHKTHRNDYGPVAILNGENTSVNFDSRPKGFRLLTIAPDNTFSWIFIPN